MGRSGICVRVGLLLSLSGFSCATLAARVEAEAGRSYMDDHAATALFVEAVFDAHRLGDSHWSIAPDVALGRIDGRDLPRFRGARYDTRTPAWLLAAGARLQYADGSRWRRQLFVSFQPAFNNARTQALSGPCEFVTSVGWQGRRFSFRLRHVSNAGLRDPNRGETMALVGVGFDL